MDDARVLIGVLKDIESRAAAYGGSNARWRYRETAP
jgi:hypothetical protein